MRKNRCFAFILTAAILCTCLNACKKENANTTTAFGQSISYGDGADNLATSHPDREPLWTGYMSEEFHDDDCGLEFQAEGNTFVWGNLFSDKDKQHGWALTVPVLNPGKYGSDFLPGQNNAKLDRTLRDGWLGYSADGDILFAEEPGTYNTQYKTSWRAILDLGVLCEDLPQAGGAILPVTVTVFLRDDMSFEKTDPETGRTDALCIPGLIDGPEDCQVDAVSADADGTFTGWYAYGQTFEDADAGTNARWGYGSERMYLLSEEDDQKQESWYWYGLFGCEMNRQIDSRHVLGVVLSASWDRYNTPLQPTETQREEIYEAFKDFARWVGEVYDFSDVLSKLDQVEQGSFIGAREYPYGGWLWSAFCQHRYITAPCYWED